MASRNFTITSRSKTSRSRTILSRNIHDWLIRLQSDHCSWSTCGAGQTGRTGRTRRTGRTVLAMFLKGLPSVSREKMQLRTWTTILRAIFHLFAQPRTVPAWIICLVRKHTYHKKKVSAKVCFFLQKLELCTTGPCSGSLLARSSKCNCSGIEKHWNL